jgi:hypothetical protein
VVGKGRGVLPVIGSLSVLVIVIAVVTVLALTAYTPTTTAYIQNDTAHSVTVDNCAEVPITIAPSFRRLVHPYEDAKHAVCTVFQGQSDLGALIGCLYFPSSRGRTIADTVIRVSEIRPPKLGAVCG